MSVERRKMLALLGAELVLTPGSAGMKGAVDKAEELLKEIPGSVIPSQFDNPANPEIHRTHHGRGDLERHAMARSTSSSPASAPAAPITGVGQVLKPRRPQLRIVAVEPEDSPLLSGGKPGPHKIQGIGANFIPAILDRSVIDEVVRIGNQPSFDMARHLARLEGIPCGISSGAAVTAALEVAARPGMEGKNIVVIIPSFAERYLSTALFEGL